MLFIIRPGFDGFNAYAFLVMLAVVSGSLRDLASRSFSSEAPSIKVALASGITNFLLGGCLSLANWQAQAPIRWEALLWAGAAVFIGTSQLCMVMGMRVGAIGFVQQFRFTGILFAVFTGLLVLGEVPDLQAAIGCVFILSAGLYSLVFDLRSQPNVTKIPESECKPTSYGHCRLDDPSKVVEGHGSQRVQRDSDIAGLTCADPGG